MDLCFEVGRYSCCCVLFTWLNSLGRSSGLEVVGVVMAFWTRVLSLSFVFWFYFDVFWLRSVLFAWWTIPGCIDANRVASSVSMAFDKCSCGAGGKSGDYGNGDRMFAAFENLGYCVFLPCGA